MATHKTQSDWIDVSIPIRNGMVQWPGVQHLEIARTHDIERGDPYTLSCLKTDSHLGTHMDAPLHFIRGGKGIDEMPLEATIGPARVIEVNDDVSIRPEALEPHRIQAGERVLFKTRNSERCWKSDEFFEDYVFLSLDAARYLASCGVMTVGVDYLSVGGFHEGLVETHQAMLGAGIWIIEGLNLSEVDPGNYELICLPLRIVGCDGAPARAVVRPSPPS